MKHALDVLVEDCMAATGVSLACAREAVTRHLVDINCEVIRRVTGMTDSNEVMAPFVAEAILSGRVGLSKKGLFSTVDILRVWGERKKDS